MARNTTRNFKRETSSRVWKPSKSTATSATRRFRAEAEELKLRSKCNRCGQVGHWARECPQQSSQGHQGGGKGRRFWKKHEQFPKKTGREAYFCDWSPGNESRCQCFFEKHNSLLDRGCRRCEQPCSKLEKARKLRLERNRFCGEFETMLNSCPGRRVVDTGRAKMMMGSDTLRQYLNLLGSKERASIERVREKNRFRFGDQDFSVVCSPSDERWRTSVP